MTEQKPEDENEILFPDRELTLAGESVTITEFTFLQEQKAVPLAQPIIQAISDAFTGDKEPGFSDIENIFFSWGEAFNQLVCMSVNKPVEWLEKLTGQEGQLLAMTFWSVNRRFFISRVVTRTMENTPGMAEKLAESLSEQPNSTAH